MPAVGRLAHALATGLMLSLVLAGSISGCSRNGVRGAAGADASSRRGLASSSALSLQQSQAAQAELERYRQHVAATVRESAAKDAQIADLRQRIADLQWRYDALCADYTEALDQRPRLPGATLGQLREFAAVHGELAAFDEPAAALVLASDLVFQPGADALTREATTMLSALALLLNDPAATSLEVRVVVYSDAKPLSESAAAAQLRRDAWELSTRRALSVAGALARAGVPLERLTGMGQGDRRPVADNGTAAGRKANRRVVICLVPGETDSLRDADDDAARVTDAGD